MAGLISSALVFSRSFRVGDNYMCGSNGSIKIVLALDLEYSDKSKMGTTSIWRPRVTPVPQDGAEEIVEIDEVRKEEESARRYYRCCATTHQQVHPSGCHVSMGRAVRRFQSQAAP